MKFADATAVEQVDSHTYSATFQEGWTIGTVPHGGYVTSTFQQVVRKHFDTTLRQQNQPHTITLHLDFLRRTQTGPARFAVKDVKLGRQTSVVHVTLSQAGREEVVGYVTNSNFEAERGASFDTHWSLHPEPVPVDVAKLLSDDDAHWAERKEWPFAEFRAVTRNVRSWFPRRGQHSPAVVDMWTCLKEGEDRWGQESLGFVVDFFPQIIDRYLLDGLDIYGVPFEREHSEEERRRLMKSARARMWYPTLLLNLDVKKALPKEGVKFLFLRLQAKLIKNGRYDLELVVKDAEGDVVALSHHVVLAVSAERNTAARRKVGTKL